MLDKRFIEQFEENVRQYPDKMILRDAETSLTFRQLDDLSGRVYAYLKARNIGREDFVMIALPHGVLPYVAMIGVWKAGAAFVIAGEGLPEERQRFIYDDCRCKLLIDEQAWTELSFCVPLVGHESTSVNDAAYAVYTSGSEGLPKGSLIEYGFLEFFAQTALDKTLISVNDYTVYFMPVPMFTVGAVNTCIQIMWSAITVDIGPLGIMRDTEKLHDYFVEHKVNVAFMPPSYLKRNNVLTPYLECIILTSEKASDVYIEGINLLNTYTQTEGYHLCWFKIDRPYDNTPIGKPTRDFINIVILDDDGNPVPKGEMGELCFERKFFRCYINDTEHSNITTDGYQRSGDIARINEDGNYVILGRKTDMIKINGNRIEPAEIEAAVKRILGIDWAFAKGFVEPERSFICVYYTADIDIDYAEMREQLLRVLPTYMIPSYFIHIDNVPLLPNGKVDRQAFRAPAVSDYATDYVAPTNELEQRLCDAMQKVLGVQRIGINDDFYLLGGDSLRTIRLVGMLNLAGLNVSDVYASRTPARIAEQWLLRQLSVEL